MTDTDLDDLFAPATPPADPETGEVVEAAVATRPGYTPEHAIVALEPLATQLGALLAGVAAPNVSAATPQERADMVALHRRLSDIIGALQVRRDAIELAFRRGMAELGADQLPLPDGRTVSIERPKPGWKVRGDELRRQLLALVTEGVVTKPEVDAALAVEVTVRPDNRRLNYLAEHRGDAVREAIEANREREQIAPTAGRLQLPR
jgi:hypothetical protein